MTNEQRAENTVRYWLGVFDEAYRLLKSGLNKEQIETSHAIDVTGQIAGQGGTDDQLKKAQQSSKFIIELACALAGNNEMDFKEGRALVEQEIREQVAEHQQTNEQS